MLIDRLTIVMSTMGYSYGYYIALYEFYFDIHFNGDGVPLFGRVFGNRHYDFATFGLGNLQFLNFMLAIYGFNGNMASKGGIDWFGFTL